MSTVNYSDTTPAPPSGATNVKWQSDANGNVSAYSTTIGPWQTWAPAYGGMTVAVATLALADWIRLGPVALFAFSVNISFSGTMATSFTISLPIPYAGADAVVLANGLSQGGNTLTSRANLSGNIITVFIGSGQFASGQTYTVRASGSYRCA
jgi:hypothetical protein